MKLTDLYSNWIGRAVNPAVSATKLDADTRRVEIQEYVFTDEILNGLFNILDAIKNNKPYSHVGIWIDGYYGSGKSHFLKYFDYCIMPETRDEALKRLVDAVGAIDPMDSKHNLRFEKSDIISIAEWLKTAVIDTCIFNLETSYDYSTDKDKAFLHVFWNEFNGKRGLNKFNITLAQLLEKPLIEKGLFDKFKEGIAEEGGNWDDPQEAADIVDNALDMVVDTACKVNSQFDKKVLYEHIRNRDYGMSIDKFANELKNYLKTKGDNYRFIFLADEVSQFINKEKDRYLNLQEVITKLSEACDNKIWIACTAQQDLSEILDDCNIAEEQDKEGKIMGRFEVKVSLKGTNPDVITQKRILDKKDEVKPLLGSLYDEIKSELELQLKLPNSYNTYDTKEKFIDYYPFVPYQFSLIMQVFNSFLALGYVAKEVKGNERSIIKVVHSTAKNKADEEVGRFISFDELYNSMFEEGLQNRGQKAVANAVMMAEKFPKEPAFAKRVANVLFMICNISQTDQLIFPATIDNITTLLINDMTTPRLTIKEKVEKVTEYLCDNNIIRREHGKNGGADYFSFYSEEEIKVAELIKSQNIDNNAQAEELKNIIAKYLKDTKNNKETFGTRSFAMGLNIKQRTFLSNNPDVVVEFAMDADYATETEYAMNNNNPNRMIYYVGPKFIENKRLRNNFYWYCKVNRYMATPPSSEDNAKTRKEFSKRAGELLTSSIEPEFWKILDDCPIISGTNVISSAELSGKKGNDRYMQALQIHFASIYRNAGLVNSPDFPKNSDSLRRAILRTINPGDYDGLKASLTPPEHLVETYLNTQHSEVSVTDIVNKFSKAPYGWNDFCTLYVINELVRRHKRDFSYTNNPNVDVQTVANRLASESNKFTVRAAKAISNELINQFLDAWKEIFGSSKIQSTSDSTQLYRMSRDKESEAGLENIISQYDKIVNEHAAYPFITPVRDMVELFRSWDDERDPQEYFSKVVADRDKAREMFDTCKEVIQFTHDQMDNYRKVISFVDNNRDNFSYLPPELQETVQHISGISTQTWPISIRTFIKQMNELNMALDAVRNEIRSNIAAAYNEAFDLLEKGCDEQGVNRSILPAREATIHIKTNSNSIPVLQINTDTNDFFADWSAKILEAKPKPTTTDGEKTEKVVTVNLQTRTASPLRTKEDVEKYLDKLRGCLMEEISKGNSVQIVK